MTLKIEEGEVGRSQIMRKNSFHVAKRMGRGDEAFR